MTVPLPMLPNLVDATPERVKAWARQLVQVLEREHTAMGGGRVTLTPDATETVLSDQLIAPGASVMLMPATASAAAALATTFVPLATVLDGRLTIQHASDAATDRTFFFVVIEPDSDQAGSV